MTRGAVVSAIVLVLLVSTLAWAGVCPLCLRQIPDGEKYCNRHKAEVLAKRVSSQEEKKLVDQATEARDQHVAALENLSKFYENRGHAEGLRKIQAELQDLREARKFTYVNWEDTLPELSATTASPQADALLKEADALRKNVNPFGRGKRLREAAAKYQEILLKYPSSTAVDSAAFGLGEVHSSSAVGEYKRAVGFFELCHRANPNTEHDALYRAAQVSDADLADYENAARFYWMASSASRSGYSRQVSGIRLRQLQKKGFGTSYASEEKEEATPEK